MDVDLDKRTKVSRACDYCKKRKFKCSGVSPCELCTKKGIQCEFSIVDRRTIRRKNKKRTIRNKPATATSSTTSKIKKDENQIDKTTLKMLTRNSKVPVQLQPLLSFPLHKLDNKQNEEEKHTQQNPPAADDTPDDERKDKDRKIDKKTHPDPPKNERAPPKVLYDSEGNLRYVGESSPLSFLFECRNIFLDRIGESDFTSESDSLEVIDEPDESTEIVQVALPSRQLLNEIVRIFYMNIQQATYFVNVEYFKENSINPVYENYSGCDPEKIALVNLVIAIGLLHAEATNDPVLSQLQSPTMRSSAYFEFGFYLTKMNMNKGKLWLTEAFSLAYCYYQAKQQRNTAWLMLGMAIRNAQALGLNRKFINESFKDRSYIVHRRRLFKTLYILDRITSILLGRPLIIDDYDWDDFDSEDVYDRDLDGNLIKDTRFECMIQACKISKLLGKVVRNYYSDGIINPYKAEKLAIELKLWSLSLPEPLQIDKIFNPSNPPSKIAEPWIDHKVTLLLLHLSQLYAIVLLSRPFFMYLIFDKKKKRKILKRPKTRPEVAMHNFCKATAKSSALIIQLVENYINTIRITSGRAELHGLTHTCFMATLIIGLSLLYLEDNGYTLKDGYSSCKQMSYLNSAKKIFEYYSQTNPISSRFYNIVEQMQLALMNKFNLDMDGNRINIKKQPQQKHENGASSTTTNETTIPTESFGVGTTDIPFNEDYDNFIDNFGNLLPTTTNQQHSTNNNMPFFMTAQPYQNTPSAYSNVSEELGNHQQQQAYPQQSPQLPDHVQQNQYLSQFLPTLDSNNLVSGHTSLGSKNQSESLDAFMYNVGLNDILYNTK